MSQYVEIFANDFCIDELKCICESCKNKFTEYAPSNYELVCFMLESGEKRFCQHMGCMGIWIYWTGFQMIGIKVIESQK